ADLLGGILADARAWEEERALRQKAAAAEARSRAFFEGVGDILLVADDRGCVRDANPAATRVLGYTRQELRGMQVSDILVLPPEKTSAIFADFLRTGAWEDEVELLRKDGTFVLAEGHATPLSPPGVGFVVLLRDIGHRRRMEASLHRLDGEVCELLAERGP